MKTSLRYRLIVAGGIVGFGLIALPQVAYSQQQANNGMFGSRTMGGTVSPGQSSFSQGAGGFGGSGMGGGGMGGMGGMGGGMGGGMNSGLAQPSARSLRGNQRGSFVGSEGRELQQNGMPGQRQLGGGRTGTNRFGGGGLGGFGGGLGGGFFPQGGLQRNLQQRFQQNQNDPLNKIRRSYQVAFPYAQPAATDIRTVVESSLIRSLELGTSGNGNGGSSPIQVEVVDRTVILRGSVATEHQWHLAEVLAGLEPGVSQVQNELVLAETGNPPTNVLSQAGRRAR